LSKPFIIIEEESILAYSEKDELYLISVELRGINISMKVVKLLDQ
jgi:hypothetical protein